MINAQHLYISGGRQGTQNGLVPDNLNFWGITILSSCTSYASIRAVQKGKNCVFSTAQSKTGFGMSPSIVVMYVQTTYTVYTVQSFALLLQYRHHTPDHHQLIYSNILSYLNKCSVAYSTYAELFHSRPIHLRMIYNC